MKVFPGDRPLIFMGSESEMIVSHTNKGESFRQGIEFTFNSLNGPPPVRVVLDEYQLRELRDKIVGYTG